MGRFTTEDPIKDGTNWYAYVGNRPLTAVDPSGLDPVDAVEGAPSNVAEESRSRRKFQLFFEKACLEAEQLPIKVGVVTTVPGERTLFYNIRYEVIGPVMRRAGDGTGTITWTTRTTFKQANPNHGGAYDIVPVGDFTVYAAASGRATTGYRDDLGYFIEVQQYNGNTARYSHLEPLEAGLEFIVRQGQAMARVARSGKLGASTGPHLDVKFTDSQGKPIDPIYDLVVKSYNMDLIGKRKQEGSEEAEYFNVPMERPVEQSVVTRKYDLEML